MKHDLNNTHEQMAWNFEDQDPNRKVLMSLQYALEHCPNMKTVQFHIDGIYPQYRTIFDHMVEEHFEGVKCLGPVRPTDAGDEKFLRALGPFTRNWWRLDQLPPRYGIPRFCDIHHGFALNRQTAQRVLRTLERSKSLEFRNEHILITGIVRQLANLDQIKSLSEAGIETSDTMLKNERTYGSFNEDDIWDHFNGLLGEKFVKKEFKILQDRMKETAKA